MFRINFWPYDHEFLLSTAGSRDASYLSEIDQLAAGFRSRGEEVDASWKEPLRIANSVVNDGFPVKGEFVEQWNHRMAAYLLVDPITRKHKYPYGEAYPTTEYGYLGFLEAFPSEVLESIPATQSALLYGRPWFGNRCDDEEVYGTVERDEIQIWEQQCISHRDKFLNPDWVLEPVLELFAFTRKLSLDLWFSVG